MVIVGNKCDRELERVVDPAELKAVTETFPGSCAGCEASAKKNINVDEVHGLCLVRECVCVCVCDDAIN
jgi:Ras family